MKKINKRTLHIYLSCFFAPALLFFILTGALQMTNLHHAKKDGSYAPPRIIAEMSSLHSDQHLKRNDKSDRSFPVFRYFAIALVMGFTLTTMLGVQLAFENRAHSGKALLFLCLGAAVPLVLILFSR